MSQCAHRHANMEWNTVLHMDGHFNPAKAYDNARRQQRAVVSSQDVSSTSIPATGVLRTKEGMHLTLRRNALRRELDTVEGTAPISMCLTDRVGSRYRQNDARNMWLGQTETGSCRVFVKETGGGNIIGA